MLRLFAWFMMGILVVALNACGDCDENDNNASDELSVQMQLVGSVIEGVKVCRENKQCKKTDLNGMVAFEEQGSYTFKINDMNLSTLHIDQNKTVISPYKLFDDNETLAQKALLMIHAFDKGDDPGDSHVLLSFSPYIPQADSLESFITTNSAEHNLTFIVNDHSNTVDFNASKIYRDCHEENTTYFDSNTSSFVTETETKCDEFELDIPTQDAYAQLDKVTTFIASADDHNVTLDGLETKYLLKQETLTSFTLGEKLRFSFFAEKEKVQVEIYDAKTRTTDKGVLLENDDATALVTNVTEINIAKE